MLGIKEALMLCKGALELHDPNTNIQSIDQFTPLIELVVRDAEVLALNLELGVVASRVDTLKTCLSNDVILSEIIYQLRALSEEIYSESSSRTIIYMPYGRAQMLNNPIRNFCSDESLIKFPKAVGELDLAKAAAAYDFPTASVFHSMRASEICLKEIARGLGIDPDGLMWGTLIDRVEKEIEPLKKDNWKGALPGDKDFYSKAILSIQSFKDAYRNIVAHSDACFTSDDSLIVIVAVGQFIKVVATRFSEPAVPPSIAPLMSGLIAMPSPNP